MEGIVAGVKGIRLTGGAWNRRMNAGLELITSPESSAISGQLKKDEVFMVAYLLLLVAVLSRFVVLPHTAWLNFTAVGGALLYFGARRPWREMIAPLAVLLATDYCLTVYAYHYPFQWQNYVPTWLWYAAAIVLGQILLHARANVTRVAAATLLGPTSFFLISNYAVWAGGGMYPRTMAGLGACFMAGIPFYRNDVISTGIVLGLMFGVPVLVRRMREDQARAVVVR
jgi:hypothetical protein